MDEFINAIVLCVASMVVGAILHSAGGHAGYNQRVRDWIEKNILGKRTCARCGSWTSNYCIIEKGPPGQNRIEDVWVRLGYEGLPMCAECYYK